MRIAFYELAPELRVGGLETAVRGLEAALRAANSKFEILNSKEEGEEGRGPRAEGPAEPDNPDLPLTELTEHTEKPTSSEGQGARASAEGENLRGPSISHKGTKDTKPRHQTLSPQRPHALSGPDIGDGAALQSRPKSAAKGGPSSRSSLANSPILRSASVSHSPIPPFSHSSAPPAVLINPDPADLCPGDVAHFHGLWSVEHWKIARELRRRGIPYVTSPHGMLEPWAIREKSWKKLPYLRLIEGTKLRAGKILATAEQEAERLRQRLGPQADVSVISLGTDMQVGPDYERARAKLGWEPQERVLLYLSRIHKKKGLLQLLQTLTRLAAEGRGPGAEGRGEETGRGSRVAVSGGEERAGLLEDARLVIVGDGDAAYVNACREAAKALEGHLRIDWHAPVWSDEKWTYLQGADLICLPTFSENFGMVVLEACQVGTPVLTTIETPWKSIADAGLGYVGPATEAFYEKALRDFFLKSGSGVSPLDPQRSGAAGHLGFRISDLGFPALPARAELATWARERFSWDALVGEYLALYEEVASCAGGPGAGGRGKR